MPVPQSTPASRGEVAVASALGMDPGAGLVGGDAVEWGVDDAADGRSEDSATSGGSGSGSGSGFGGGGGLSLEVGVASAALDSSSARLALDLLAPMVSSWPGPLQAAEGLAEELTSAATEADRVLGLAVGAAARGLPTGTDPGLVRRVGAHVAQVRSAGAAVVGRSAWLCAMAQRAAAQWVFSEYECVEDGDRGGFDSDSDECGQEGSHGDGALEGGDIRRWWAAGTGDSDGAGAEVDFGMGRASIMGGFVTGSDLLERPSQRRQLPSTSGAPEHVESRSTPLGPFDER